MTRRAFRHEPPTPIPDEPNAITLRVTVEKNEALACSDALSAVDNPTARRLGRELKRLVDGSFCLFCRRWTSALLDYDGETGDTPEASRRVACAECQAERPKCSLCQAVIPDAGGVAYGKKACRRCADRYGQ